MELSGFFLIVVYNNPELGQVQGGMQAPLGLPDGLLCSSQSQAVFLQTDPSPTRSHSEQLSLYHAGLAIVWLLVTPAFITKINTMVTK